MTRPALSIDTVLTTVLVLLITLAAGGVGVSAWSNTVRSLELGWVELADGVAEGTVYEVTHFLAPAAPSAALAEATVDAGGLDVADQDGLLRWADDALRANPDVTWFGWAGAEGSYLASMRWQHDGVVEHRRTARVPTEGRTWHRDWALRDGTWVEVSERWSDYDSRLRPYWLQASGSPDPMWIDPYLFSSRQQPGISYAAPSFTGDGVLRGMWVVDFECGPLSAYLSSLEIGRTGRAYLVDGAGRVIGHPDGEVASDGAILRAADHPDAWLASAWTTLVSRGAEPGTFEVDDLLASAHRFPEESGVPWWVVVVVPKDELYGEAGSQARWSIGLTVLVMLLASGVGLVFSRSLSSSVANVEGELRRLARFDLSGDDLAEQRSVFREINALSAAHDRMKQGLASFGRYVPRQLVGHMLRTGEEARLGGEVQPITVLFCGIQDFDAVAEKAPANVLLGELSDYLSGIDETIALSGGTVAQYLGDTAMAFWGAPDRGEDHALRACRAALAMLGAIDRLDGQLSFPSSIGVNTGDCMVGNIGSEHRFNFTILGDPVNTAARINGLNRVYGTRLLIGELTAAQVVDQLWVRPVDWVRVKGRVEPLLVHELLGELDAAAPGDLAAVEDYRRALEAYREGRFEEAAVAFERTRWPEPMASRARSYAGSPPPADWDGVHVMGTK